MDKRLSKPRFEKKDFEPLCLYLDHRPGLLNLPE